MIYYNSNTINDWNFGDDNIIKVYRNNAVCYYKITGGGDTPTAQTPCFAVVDDISQYSDTEFEDVFNKADNKWYKLNNLNQYEQYGIYGSGRTITTYEGKLTIDDGYEYMYSGGSWVNVGEVSGSSRAPVGCTELEWIEMPQTSPYCAVQLVDSYSACTNLYYDFTIMFNSLNDTRIIGFNNNNSYLIGYNNSTIYLNIGNSRKFTINGFTTNTVYHFGLGYKNGSYVFENLDTSTIYSTFNTSLPKTEKPYFGAIKMNGTFYVNGDSERIYSIKVYDNDVLVGEYIPIKRNNDNFVTLYDLILEQYSDTTGGGIMVAGSEVTGQTEYPLYYDEKSDPPNNLTFSSMTEAESYECPWVGMSATINGSAYTFSGDAISGYEWVYNPIDYSTHYLSMVAQTNGVSFKYDTATSSNSLQYSLDSGSTWNILSNGQSTSSINNGEKIMFKASSLTVNTERGIGRITPSSSATVEGNIMSLAYGDNFSGQTVIPNNYQFRKLFSGVTTITSAENMVLPATTVKQQCYSQMFQGCTSLVVSPKVIGSSAMTWSGQYCFSDMFHDCTSLTTVPSGLLPATTLGERCCWCMFNNCTSLTTAPTLPATTLVSNCYLEMFKGCTNLNYIEALFTTTPSSSYMSNWVDGVASSGTFVKNSSATWSTSCGASTYPCNWTVQNG